LEKIKNFDLQKIKTCTLFKQLSDVTLVTMYDNIERRIYKAGSLLSSQAKYSLVNFDYHIFAEKQMNTISTDDIPDNFDEPPKVKSVFVKAVSKVSRLKTKIVSIVELVDNSLKNRVKEKLKAKTRVAFISKFTIEPKEYFDCSDKNFNSDPDGIYIIFKGT